MFRPTDLTRRHETDEDVFPLDAFVSGQWAGKLLALAREHGFRHCLLASFPKGDRPEFSANLLVTNWPQAVREAYEAAEIFAGSLLVARLKQTIMPVFSTENLFVGQAPTEQRAKLLALFDQHGMGGSLTFSLHDRHLAQYILVFSGRPEQPDRAELAIMQFAAMEMLDLGADELVPRYGPREKLSAREVECLRWSAAGKSSDEIAIILDISTHTVVSYLKSAMRKLEAVNRMQAVARACRFRLL